MLLKGKVMNIIDIKCKCPSCGASFEIGNALEEQAVDKIRAQMRLENDQEIQEQLREERIKAIEDGKKIGSEEYLKLSEKKQKELDDVSKSLTELKISQAEKDSEINKLRSMQEAAINLKLAEQKTYFETEKVRSEMAFKMQIEQLTNDLKKASERASQGSIQRQGEVSELAIEETLKMMFPNDDVVEIKKGHRGADCMLQVRHKSGRIVGKILFESKDTKSFCSSWIPKLKDDTVNQGAQVSILVTSAFPSDMKKAHERNGVWVCGFHEYQILVRALRQSLLEISKLRRAEEARDGHAQAMFNFLTSQEFAHIIERIVSPILRMNEQLQKEKRSISRLWKEREALIEGSISGTESLYMKIQGIAQVNLPSVSGFEAIEAINFDKTNN